MTGETTLTTDRAVLLSRTFALASEARAAGDHPFGALLALDGIIVSEARNQVNTHADVSAHAEMMLVRILQREGNIGLLSNGVVYASCEPCPMCVGVLFWAGARHIVFGLTAKRLTELSTMPDETPFAFTITAQEIAARTTLEIFIEGPFMEEQASQPHIGFWM